MVFQWGNLYRLIVQAAGEEEKAVVDNPEAPLIGCALISLSTKFARLKEIAAFAAQPDPWRFSALARRSGVGELLCSVPQGAGVVVGDLLAGWRRGELDHRTVVDGVATYA